MGLVRDDIVENAYDCAAAPHPAADIAKGRREPAHPVADNQQVRLPFPDCPHGPAVSQRIGRVQHGCAPHRHGLIVPSHFLCPAREEEIRILPRKIEGSDIVTLAQFLKKTGVELGNPSSVRVETGQQRYSQLFLPLFATYSSFSPAITSSVMSSDASPVMTGAPP